MLKNIEHTKALVLGWSLSALEHRREAFLGIHHRMPRLVIEQSQMSVEQDIKSILLMAGETHKSMRDYGHLPNSAFAKIIAKQQAESIPWLGEIPESINDILVLFSGQRSQEFYVEIRYPDQNGVTPYKRLEGKNYMQYYLASETVAEWKKLVSEQWVIWLAT